MKRSTEDVRLMVVDDEFDVVDSIVSMLETEGYNTEGETDSKRLSERLGSEKYDIVITDFKMPDVSGLELAKRSRETNPDGDVIIITAFGSMELAIDALRKGVYDFILKPFKFEELLHAIERALEKQRLKRENEALRRDKEKYLDELTTLYDINEIVLGSEDLNEVLRFATDTMVESLGINSGSILMEGAEKDVFRSVQSIGIFSEPVHSLEFDINDEKINKMALTSGVTEINDTSNGALLFRNNSSAGKIQKIWTIPMVVGSSLVGFLAVANLDANEELSEGRLKLLNVLANQLAPLLKVTREIDRSRQNEGTIDHVRGLITESVERVKRYNGNVSFLHCRVAQFHKGGISGSDVAEIMDRIKILIERNLAKQDRVIQVGFDGYMVILFGKNKLETELYALDLKANAESVAPKFGPPSAWMKMNSFSYPEDSTSVADLMNEMLYSTATERDNVVFLRGD